MKLRYHSGFTMMEILVAMSLLTVVAATAFSSFSSSTMISHSNSNTALNVARGYLEQLYEYVRQDTFGNANAPLALTGPTTPTANTQVLDGVTYTTTYTVNGNSGAIVDANGDGQED